MALKNKGDAAQAAPDVVGESLQNADESAQGIIEQKPEKADVKQSREAAALKYPNKFILRHNLPVNGSVGVYVDGEELSVKADKGIIEFVPESFEHGLKIRHVLTRAGWVDETVYPINRPIDAPEPIVKQPKKWFFHHPDTHPTDGEQINCRVGLYVDDIEVSVEIVDSRCVIENAKIAAALEKIGYVVDHVEF